MEAPSAAVVHPLVPDVLAPGNNLWSIASKHSKPQLSFTIASCVGLPKRADPIGHHAVFLYSDLMRHILFIESESECRHAEYKQEQTWVDV